MKIEVRLSGEGLGAWIPEPWGDPKVGRTLEAGGLDFGGLEPGFRSRGGIQGWGGAWRLEAWILEAWSLDSGAVAGSKGGEEPGFRSLEA